MKNKVFHNSNDEVIMGKQWWSRFGKGIMPTLSKLSKAFLLPIALLPIAGVFLGIGATITANTTEHSVGWFIGSVMNEMGNVAFSNLPILFAISVALAYTKDSGIAAITAVVGFLVFNGIQSGLLTAVPKVDDRTTIDHYTMLWWQNISPSLVTSNLGINSLNTGVFAAIFVGAISAKMYNKFYQTQLPKLISFFSGTKLVPIVTFIAVIPLSFIFMFTWPGIGVGLSWFGTNTGKLPKGVDSLIYEIIERSLIPFGLHHVFYAPLWWTSAGGSIADAFDKAYNDPNFISHFTSHAELQAFFDGIDKTSEAWTKWISAQGDQTAMYQVIAHPNWLNFKDLESLGYNFGRFQSGKFAFMMFGLPMGAAAIVLNLPKENRKQVLGIYFSAAFTSFLTGITEPIEYTFLFVAPWLFYGIHMPLAAISFFLTSFMGVHVAMTVSGGMIDYIVFGLIPMVTAQTNPLHILWIGAVMAGLYFPAFYFSIKIYNMMKLKKAQPVLDLPGMKLTGNVQLYTKADYKTKTGKDVDLNTLLLTKQNWLNEIEATHDEKMIKAAKIIEYLGGPTNIQDVDACASRLRVTVKDNSLVDLEKIKSLGGSTGGLIKGNNIQIVYGGEQEAIKPRMNQILQTLEK